MKEKKIPPVGRYPLSILMAAGINLALEGEEETEKSYVKKSDLGGIDNEKNNMLDPGTSPDSEYDSRVQSEGEQPVECRFAEGGREFSGKQAGESCGEHDRERGGEHDK